MSLFGGLRVAESALNIHRMRSEVAAENIANINTPGYSRREVILRPGSFSSELEAAASRGGVAGFQSASSRDSMRGAVEVAGIRSVGGGTDSTRRQDAFQATIDMMRAKGAYDLNIKVATMLKGMAMASLEIGRGG